MVREGDEIITANRRQRHRHLVSALRVLAYANRVELIEILRAPHTLDEIRLAPGDFRTGSRPGRPLARQSVREHLDKLVDAGIVRARATRRDGRRSSTEYLLDQSRLFAVSEELRRLAAEGPLERPDVGETEAAVASPQARWPAGPKLVIVHGVAEGRAFPLASRKGGKIQAWIIGRSQDLDVGLDYDPFVSRRHAEIQRSGPNFTLRDLGNARNGTYLNWSMLPPRGEHVLRPGDVVGAGQTLLLFRDD